MSVEGQAGRTVDDLACPACRGTLVSESDAYTCGACGDRYPVVDGVPRFVNPRPDVEWTRRSFDLQWKRSAERGEYNQFDPEFRGKLVSLLLEDVMLPASAFRDLRVLDAGCGVGRWTYAMAELGAYVTAIDYNDEAVAITHDYFKSHPSVQVLQADVTRPPLAPGSFDLVFSWGVLHHTLNTKQAFDALAQLVAPGGIFFVMLYERYNPFKLWLTEQVRRWTVPMDRERLYHLMEHWAKWCRYRVIRYPLKPFIDIGWSAEGNYDAFAKALNHHHTAEEVRGWFADAGFRDITLNASRELRNPVFRMLQGRWGGTLRMRATRVADPEATTSELHVVRGGG